MKSLWLLVALEFVANGFAGVPCCAGEPTRSVDSVLAKWEDASQKCRSLDAKLKVFRYDRGFGDDRPTIEQGRFYYEAPNLGRYQVGQCGEGMPNDWPKLSEAIIWNGKETLHIRGETRTCSRFPRKDSSAFADKSRANFWGFFAGLFWRLERPQRCLPLVIDIRAHDVRERFDVTIERSGEEIELKATPKQPPEKTFYREVRVILNTNTYLTSAIQVTTPNGIDRTVFVLHDQKVNQRPADRDQLINPDLSGLRVTSVE